MTGVIKNYDTFQRSRSFKIDATTTTSYRYMSDKKFLSNIFFSTFPAYAGNFFTGEDGAPCYVTSSIACHQVSKGGGGAIYIMMKIGAGGRGSGKGWDGKHNVWSCGMVLFYIHTYS